ncbi:MAG: hypothetical protein ABH873_04135 [Candidatus Firestonebacteria bacterium]
MPNLGGIWISDEDIKKAEQLQGQEQDDFCSQKIFSILDNFNSTPLMSKLLDGEKPNGSENNNDSNGDVNKQ